MDDDERLQERVRFIHESIGTDAIVERFIDGRELYVGVVGNQRLQVFPVWELRFDTLPEDGRLLMTDRAKWNTNYQKKYGIMTGPADLAPEVAARVQHLCKRIYRTLDLSGYARIDLRLDEQGRVYVLEANPNPAARLRRGLRRVGRARRAEYEGLLQNIINNGLRWRPERTDSARWPSRRPPGCMRDATRSSRCGGGGTTRVVDKYGLRCPAFSARRIPAAGLCGPFQSRRPRALLGAPTRTTPPALGAQFDAVVTKACPVAAARRRCKSPFETS